MINACTTMDGRNKRDKYPRIDSEVKLECHRPLDPLAPQFQCLGLVGLPFVECFMTTLKLEAARDRKCKCAQDENNIEVEEQPCLP